MPPTDETTAQPEPNSPPHHRSPPPPFPFPTYIKSKRQLELALSTCTLFKSILFRKYISTMPRKFFIGLVLPANLGATRSMLTFEPSGNFKMNGSLSSIEKIVRSINEAKLDGTNQVVIAPPALYLLKVQSELERPAEVSAQNAFTESSGAFTGEIAPQQLKDANVHWVILGHSERRSLFGDTDKLVADKVRRQPYALLPTIR